MSFSTAISGLNAAQNLLSVTGNNVANANTTGFKRSRSEFGDIYNNNIYSVGDTSPGAGVKVSRVAQLFEQGNLEYTENSLDLAISGEGFFVTAAGIEDTQTRFFTRAGTFSVNKEGYVVNNLDRPLLVYPPNGDGTDLKAGFSTGEFKPLQLSSTQSNPRATTEIALRFNLNSKDSKVSNPATFDPVNADTYNWSSSATVYDSLGKSHTATSYFLKTADATTDAAGVTTPARWEMRVHLDGQPLTTDPAAIQPTFDANGNIISLDGTSPAAGTTPVLTFTAGGVPIPGAEDLNIAFDLGKSTQQAVEYSTNGLNQNGFPVGNLTGINIDGKGVIFATFSNGDSQIMGKVVTARFQNQQGLNKTGNTDWTQSIRSGEAIYGEATVSSFGSITSGALENSNVDIAAQLINMIIAQQTYQANAQSITTENTMTQAILNIR